MGNATYLGHESATDRSGDAEDAGAKQYQAGWFGSSCYYACTTVQRQTGTVVGYLKFHARDVGACDSQERDDALVRRVRVVNEVERGCGDSVDQRCPRKGHGRLGVRTKIVRLTRQGSDEIPEAKGRRPAPEPYPSNRIGAVSGKIPSQVEPSCSTSKVPFGLVRVTPTPPVVTPVSGDA